MLWDIVGVSSCLRPIAASAQSRYSSIAALTVADTRLRSDVCLQSRCLQSLACTSLVADNLAILFPLVPTAFSFYSSFDCESVGEWFPSFLHTSIPSLLNKPDLVLTHLNAARNCWGVVLSDMSSTHLNATRNCWGVDMRWCNIYSWSVLALRGQMSLNVQLSWWTDSIEAR